eukprot:4532163-Alexandrium_andersonii.AAC.1
MRLACRNLGLSGSIGKATTLALEGPARSTHTGGSFTRTIVPNSRSQRCWANLANLADAAAVC